MEDYLLYLFGELTEVHSEIYPDSRFWKNDEYGVILELRKSGYLCVHYGIWSTFSKFFSLQYNETQQVMKDLLEEHLKLGGITPWQEHRYYLDTLEEHLKLGGITPANRNWQDAFQLEEHLKLGGITPNIKAIKAHGNWKNI